MFDLHDALRYVVRQEGSDLHLKVSSRPLARIATVPHHLSLEGLPETSEAAARQALGIEPGTFAVATFGFLTAAQQEALLKEAVPALAK